MSPQRPLTDMKATTPIFQSAHLHSSPFNTTLTRLPLVVCPRQAKLYFVAVAGSSVPSLVTSRRAAPLFQ